MNKIKALLLAALGLLSWQVWSGELVRHVTLQTGATRFQIQNALPGQSYWLQLENLRDSRQVTNVVGFRSEGLAEALVSDFKVRDEGVYLIHLFRGNGELNLHRAEIPIPEMMEVANAEIDRRGSTVRWRTPRSSLARVNAVLNSGMRIDTIAPWHFTSNHDQFSLWDFKDRVKIKDYRDHPNLRVFVQFIPLPDYLVVVGRPPLADYAQHPLFRNLPLPAGDQELTFEVLTKSVRRVSDLPGKDLPVVKPGTALRVRLDPRTRMRLGINRYEIMFYVDGEFLHEESEGLDPYTFLLPKLPRDSGLIYLSANMSDYNGNSGTSTIPVWYDPQSQ